MLLLFCCSLRSCLSRVEAVQILLNPSKLLPHEHFPRPHQHDPSMAIDTETEIALSSMYTPAYAGLAPDAWIISTCTFPSRQRDRHHPAGSRNMSRGSFTHRELGLGFALRRTLLLLALRTPVAHRSLSFSLCCHPTVESRPLRLPRRHNPDCGRSRLFVVHARRLCTLPLPLGCVDPLLGSSLRPGSECQLHLYHHHHPHGLDETTSPLYCTVLI